MTSVPQNMLHEKTALHFYFCSHRQSGRSRPGRISKRTFLESLVFKLGLLKDLMYLEPFSPRCNLFFDP